jgi:hypothetical protein
MGLGTVKKECPNCVGLGFVCHPSVEIQKAPIEGNINVEKIQRAVDSVSFKKDGTPKKPAGRRPTAVSK